MNDAIYLDCNASAPLLPCAKAVMDDVYARPHNASSVHRDGREARKHTEQARAVIAGVLGIPAAQIIFNSGATEGNNTVLHHFKNAFPDERILVSAIEHKAVLDCGTERTLIPVTAEGIIDLKALETLLADGIKTSLVSVMIVNNETGIIQPIKEISDLAHSHGALLHCDGVQAFGRIPLDMNDLGIDFLTLSSHKIGGSQGVGALALRLCGQTPVLLQGGGQEKGARAGTENVAGIAGFGAAAEYALSHHDQLTALQSLRDHLEAQLIELCPNCIIFGQDVPRVSNTSLFALPGASSETMMMALDLEGIAVSNGSACTSGRVEPSHVLNAMGIESHIANGAIRISLGWNNTQNDINYFLTTFSKLYNRLS